ncbi:MULTISPECIES: peptidase inhibitor family I36 protein [unclassified Amycolatopsis]|uniref:peptidase inhibitor family I36 protein n=1 Tax=unclassified Amycolatopsis TaxID=2618356 RepID=UPI00287B7E11|nr:MULTISPECIES: peptidase inhibitor family I36 protein [unclassified Amycolatopsis]
MGTIGKNVVRTSLAVGAAAALAMAVTGTASAATPRNGKCELGEFCLWYGYNQTGSVSDFNGSVSDYGTSQPTCYEFKGPGLGQGECIRNNALSVKNNTTGHTIFLYFNGGHYQLSVGQALNVGNRDTSHTFIRN